MNPIDRWQAVSELFNDALERSPSKREAFLEHSCDNESILQEVRALLADEETEDDLLARPYFSLHSSSGEPEATGRRIGPYRLLKLLGRGGMGAVHLAERADGEFEQRVAIKLLHPSLASDEVMRRFRGERQILAKLAHPNVAQLLDGGTTSDGFPYIAMEYVNGRRIDDHCNANGLSIRQRLELFRTLCAAVSFAHQNLVIHRDLKPGNVLVTAEGHVKLLDFGIAKLLAADQPPATQLGRTPLTPPYASPEQIRGETVNTASDIYSLGVMLYELLTGRRPHRDDDPERLAQAICEKPPRRPSTVEFSAGPHCDEQKQLRKRLAGDLDNIVLKALRKEPAERFSSVERFSEDVQRHLDGLPVLSRPSTLAYRATKFITRHRWGVTVAVLLVVLIGAFTTSTALQNSRIARQVQETLRERDRARSVTEFLVDVLGETDPRRAKGEIPDVREVLDATSVRLDTEMLDEPLIRATLLDVIGRVYHSLDLREGARFALEEALALRRAHLAPGDPVLAESLHNLAGLERGEGRLNLAESLMREALAIQRAVYIDGHPGLARGLSNHASLLRELSRPEEAEPLAREALAMQRDLLGEEHIDVAITLNNLGRILVDRGQPDEAEAAFWKSIEIRLQSEGPDDLGLAKVFNNLAMLFVDQQERPAEALPLYWESLRIRRKVYGDDHPTLVSVLNNLGVLLISLDRLEEADAAFEEALTLDIDPWKSAILQKNRALLLIASGDYAACEELAREVLTLLRADDQIAEARSIRGGCLAGLGRLDEAEPLLREGYEALFAKRGENDRRTRQARARLAALTPARPLIPKGSGPS